jgi:hypothetical protein
MTLHVADYRPTIWSEEALRFQDYCIHFLHLAFRAASTNNDEKSEDQTIVRGVGHIN